MKTAKTKTLGQCKEGNTIYSYKNTYPYIIEESIIKKKRTRKIENGNGSTNYTIFTLSNKNIPLMTLEISALNRTSITNDFLIYSTSKKEVKDYAKLLIQRKIEEVELELQQSILDFEEIIRIINETE